jgi:hypothetical protein
MKRMKFCDVPPGTQFTFQRRTYLKLRLNMAQTEDLKSVLFPTNAEVEDIREKHDNPVENDSIVPGRSTV